MNYAEIKSRLTALALPVPNPPGLNAIRSIEGDRFNQRLSEAEAMDDIARDYLASVIKATSPFCIEVLDQNRFQSDLPTLIRVAAHQGPNLFRALNALKTGGDVGSVAETYLSAYFRFKDDVGTVADPDRLPDFAITPKKPLPAQGRSAMEADSEKSIEAKPFFAINPLTRQQPAPQAKSEALAIQEQATRIEPAKKYNTHRVYGQKYAMCFGDDMTIDGNTHTVRIEGAKASGIRTYNWDKKIGVQLTQAEIFTVLSVLFLHLQKVVLEGHGQKHDKTFTIENQGDHFYFKISQLGVGTFALPISGADTIPISTMLLKQIKLNAPHLDNTMILTMISNAVTIDMGKHATTKFSA